jgi:uncharacterized protein YcfL
MKKYTFIMTLVTVFALTSCGSGSTTSETTDSTSTQVDTTAVSADTTVATPAAPVEGPADGTVQKPEVEQVH